MAKEERALRTGEKLEEKSQGQNNRHYRDSSGKTIFKDPVLCSQFLKNYVDVPMLKDVKPEDIEDVSERYVHMFTEERESDVVKKVNLKNNPFFLVSLIEHKSDVDYNVVMQVFRYITFIWEDFEKEQERLLPGSSKAKEFRYPPVLPIIFYDGRENWTAATSLHDRVLFSDVLGKYIPDYRCILIQLKEFSNVELMKKRDELSVLMLIDKLKNAKDYAELKEDLRGDFLETVLEETPEYLLKLMSEIVETFLSKLNIPQGEVELFTGKIKERKMGELFKYFEGWDVQALRREIEETRRETRKEMEEAGIRKLLDVIMKFHISKEDAVKELMEEYHLNAGEAEEKVKLYWRE